MLIVDSPPADVTRNSDEDKDEGLTTFLASSSAVIAIANHISLQLENKLVTGSSFRLLVWRRL
jgi:hypothetical protein